MRERKEEKNTSKTLERNIKKKLRNEGKQYGEKHDIQPEKIFTCVEKCCNKICCNNLPRSKQEIFFNSFWDIGDYNQQNYFLSGLCKKSVPKATKVSPQTKNRKWSWTYYIDVQGEKSQVCKTFLYSVLQVNTKRIDVLQKKMTSNESLCDMRGKHTVRPNRIEEEVWELLNIFCKQIPNKTSHYSKSKTGRLYFCNPELNIQVLYDMFREYYLSVSGSHLPVALSTFHKYFNTNMEYSFRRPRIDVCDLCFKVEQGNGSAEENIEYQLHSKRFGAYKRLKSNLLQPKEDTLVIEFDYAQNLPLPRIPVTEQFYKRLLWMFIFNVHVHSNGNSYMFHFMEGEFKKGANSICSFVYKVLKKELAGRRNLVVFSDACSGQNRNQTVVRFFLYLSITMGLNITHVFPVRGHSYCQCDRNFATYSQKVKKREIIDTLEAYISIIEHARSPPFSVLKGTVLDFDMALKQCKKLKLPSKGLHLLKARIISYNPNGSLVVQENYDIPLSKEYKVVANKKELEDLKFMRAPRIGVKKAKLSDVQSLISYLTENGQRFIRNLIETSSKPPSQDDESTSVTSDSES